MLSYLTFMTAKVKIKLVSHFFLIPMTVLCGGKSIILIFSSTALFMTLYMMCDPWPSIISNVGRICQVPTTNISSNHMTKSSSSVYPLGDFPYKQP